MKKLFLFKGNHNVLKIDEISGKAHAITTEGTFKIRENPHSNTFLVSPYLSPIYKIYELSPLNYREIYDSLAFTSFINTVWWDSPLCEVELSVLRKKYFLLQDNCSISKIAKISYSEIIKVLKYLESLENPDDFSLFEKLDNGHSIKQWVLGTFKGVSYELGFFILLDCMQKGKLEAFVVEWKQADLLDIDLRGFLEYLDNSFLEKAERTKVKLFLSKLV